MSPGTERGTLLTERSLLGAARGAQRALLRAGVAPVVVLDAVRVAVAYAAVLILRFDGVVPSAHWERFLRFVPLAIGLHLLTNWRFRLYEQVWRHASVVEAGRVVGASAVSLLALLVIEIVNAPRVPISVVVSGSLLATALTGASRFQSRLLASLNRKRPSTGTRVAVIGSGETAAMLIRAMRADESPTAFVPVAVLADDEHGHSLLGVPVLGPVEDLHLVVDRLAISHAVLAVAEPAREELRRCSAAAELARIPLKLVADMREVIGGAPVSRRARDVRIEDLLGREEVSIDLDAVRRTIQGKRVLITGGGGSIGAEIARQVARLDPAKLLLLDHDETHLFETAMSLDVPSQQLLADVRDREVIEEIFAAHQPEVVFHAAAHKHVVILQDHPCEAVRTNVLGTQHVLRAAADHGTERLVFISTDKAVDPTSIMGTSKWVGERLVQTYAPAERPWCAVRFGNVLGSRGSVIPLFAGQIDAGGPVTVRDPRMTRYFMSISEAVQLVLQAATFAEAGDIFLLEMGEPVNILEMARKMIRLSGLVPDVDIAITFTGAHPGEKLQEQLLSDQERLHPTGHPSIRSLQSPAVAEDELLEVVDKLREVASSRDERAAASLLLDLPARWARPVDAVEEDPAWSPAST